MKINSIKTASYLSTILLLAFVFAACAPSLSQQKIIRGELIDRSSLNTTDAVVFVNTVNRDGSMGACTATIVSTNTVITAAHCVPPISNGRFDKPEVRQAGKVNGTAPICISNAVYTRICTNEIYKNPKFNLVDLNATTRHDVAVLVFKDHPFKDYASLSLENDLKPGDGVLLVGYSGYDLSPQGRLMSGGPGKKRFGRNTVDSQNAEIISRLKRNEGVLVTPGDSGGPMFDNQCVLRGVTSAMSGGQSIHAAIGFNQEYFAKVKAVSGANYCGLPGADSAGCPAAGRYYLNENAAAFPDEFPCVNAHNAAKLKAQPGPNGTLGSVDLLVSTEKRADRFFILTSLTAGSIHQPVLCSAAIFDDCFVTNEKGETSLNGEKAKQLVSLDKLGNRDIYAREVTQAMIQAGREHWVFAIGGADGRINYKRQIRFN